jgi:hypothetical protein
MGARVTRHPQQVAQQGDRRIGYSGLLAWNSRGKASADWQGQHSYFAVIPSDAALNAD